MVIVAILMPVSQSSKQARNSNLNVYVKLQIYFKASHRGQSAPCWWEKLVVITVDDVQTPLLKHNMTWKVV